MAGYTPLYPPGTDLANTPLYPEGTPKEETPSLFPLAPIPAEPTSPEVLRAMYGSSELTRGVRRGLEGLGGTTLAAGAQVAEAFGAKAISDKLFDEARALLAPRPGTEAAVPEFNKIRSVGDAGSYTAAKVGEFLPALGLGMAGGALGSAVGLGLRASPMVSGMVGGAGMLAPSEMGTAALTLRDDPEAMRRTTPMERTALSAGQGIVNSALYVPPALGAVRRAIGPLTGRRGLGAAAAELGIGTAESAASLGAASGAQEAIRQGFHGYANPARDTSQDWERIKEATVAGAVGSLPMGLTGGAVRGARTLLTPDRPPPVAPENRPPPGYVAGYDTMAAMHRAADALSRKFGEWTQSADKNVKASVEWTDGKTRTYEELMSSPFAKRLKEEGKLDDGQVASLVSMMHAMEETPARVTPEMRQLMTHLLGADPAEVWQYIKYKQKRGVPEPTEESVAGIERTPDDSLDAGLVRTGQYEDEANPFLTEEQQESGIDAKGTAKELFGPLELPINKEDFQRSVQNMYWYRDWENKKQTKKDEARRQFEEEGGRGRFVDPPQPHLNVRLSAEGMTGEDIAKLFDAVDDQAAPNHPVIPGPFKAEDLKKLAGRDALSLPIQPFALAKRMQKLISGHPDSEYFKGMTPEQREEAARILKDTAPPIREGTTGDSAIRNADLAMHALNTLLANGIEIDGKRIKVELDGSQIPENLIVGGMPKGGKGKPYTLRDYTNEVRASSKKGADQLKVEREIAGDLAKRLIDVKTGRGGKNWSWAVKEQYDKAFEELKTAMQGKSLREASRTPEVSDQLRRFKVLDTFKRQSTGILAGHIMTELRKQYRAEEQYAKLTDAELNRVINQDYPGGVGQPSIFTAIPKEKMTPLYEKTAADFYKGFNERNVRQSAAHEIDAYHEAVKDLAGDRQSPRGETEQLIADLQRYFDPATLGEASPLVLKFQKDNGLMHFSKELLKSPELRNSDNEPIYIWLQRELERLYNQAEEMNLSSVYDVDTIADTTGTARETDTDVYGSGRNVPPISKMDTPSKWAGPFAKTRLIEKNREVGDGGEFFAVDQHPKVGDQFFAEDRRARMIRNLDARNKLIDDWGPYRLWQQQGKNAHKWGYFHSEDEVRTFLDALPDDGFAGLRIKVGAQILTLEQAKAKYGWDGAAKKQSWGDPSRATATVYNPKTGRTLATVGGEKFSGLPEQMVSKLDNLQRHFPNKEGLKVVDDTPLFTDEQGTRRLTSADLDKALTVTKPTVHNEGKVAPEGKVDSTLPIGEKPLRSVEAGKNAAENMKLGLEKEGVTDDFGTRTTMAKPHQKEPPVIEGPVPGAKDVKEIAPQRRWMPPKSDLTPLEAKAITDDFGVIVQRSTDFAPKEVPLNRHGNPRRRALDITGKRRIEPENLRDETSDQALRKLLRDEIGKFVGPVRVMNDGRQLARVVIKIAEKHGGEQRRLRYSDENGTVLSFEDGTRVRYSLQDDGKIKLEGLQRIQPTAEELAALQKKLDERNRIKTTPEQLAEEEAKQTARVARVHAKWIREAKTGEKMSDAERAWREKEGFEVPPLEPKKPLGERFRTEEEVRLAAEQHFYVTEYLPKREQLSATEKDAVFQQWADFSDHWAAQWKKAKAKDSTTFHAPIPEKGDGGKTTRELLGDDVVARRIDEASAVVKKFGFDDETVGELRKIWEKLNDISTADKTSGERAGKVLNRILEELIVNAPRPAKPTKQNMKKWGESILDLADALFAPVRRTTDEAEAAFRTLVDNTLGEHFKADLRALYFAVDNDGNLVPKAGGYDATPGKPEKITISTIAFSAADNADAALRDVANHEIMHAALTRIERMYGIDAAKKLVDAANAQHVRDQVLAATGDKELRAYYRDNPEEMLVQAYSVWSDGQLKLNPANILQKFFASLKKAVKKLFDTMGGDDLLANVFEAVKRGELKDKKISGKQAEDSMIERIKAGFINYDANVSTSKSKPPEPSEVAAKQADVLAKEQQPPEPGQTRPVPPEAPKPAQTRPISPDEVNAKLQEAEGQAAKGPPKPPEPPAPPPGGDGTTPPGKPPIDELTQKLRGIVRNIVGKEARLYRDEQLSDGKAGMYVGREMLDEYTKNMDALREVWDARRRAIEEGDTVLRDKLNAEERALIKRTRVLSMIYIAPHLGERDAIAQTYHESLHAAFDLLLTPDERATLATAFSKGPVARRLREIFKNDEAVLAALRDPEEAAAYGFRVYAMAPEQLQLGQRVKTMFDRIVKFFHDLFGIVTNEEKAQILMDNMLSGRRLERGPDRVAQALEAHMTGPQKLQRLARTFGGVMKGMWDFLATSSYERVMAMDNPAAAQIAKLAYTKQSTTNEPLGYIQAQRAAITRVVNEFDKLTGDLDLKKFNEAYEARIMGKDLGTAEAKIIGNFFDKIYRYYQEAERQAGVESGKGIGFETGPYAPLVWDAEKVASSREAFVKMLEKPEYAQNMKNLKATPNEIWNNISNYVIRGEALTEIIRKGEPTNDFAKTRSLGFIKPEDRRPFMSDDHLGSMLRYAQQMTRSAEYIRAFGKNGEKLQKLYGEAQQKYGATQQQMELIQDFMAGIMGDKAVGMSRAQKDLYGAVIVYQNLRLLPLNLFSSLVDPLGIAVRSGSMTDAGEAFLYNVKNIFRDLKKNRPYMDKDKWEKMAQDWGIIEDAGMMSNISSMYENLDIRGTNRKISDAFFKYNLLNGWERNTKIMATKAGERFLVRLKEDFFGEHNQRYLEELGLKKSDIILDSNGDLVTNTAQMEAQGVSADAAKQIEKRLQDAMVKFVNQAVLNPTAADFPNWGSNPYLAPIFHLKQFMFTFQSTILKRMAEEAKQGNYKPLWVAGAYIPGMIGADIMRAMITNGGSLPAYQQNWDWLDYLYNGIDRAGLTGAGSLITGIKDDILHGGTGAESALGPALEQLKNGVSAMGKGDQAKVNWLVKALPGQALFSKSLTGPTGAPPRD